MRTRICTIFDAHAARLASFAAKPGIIATPVLWPAAGCCPLVDSAAGTSLYLASSETLSKEAAMALTVVATGGTGRPSTETVGAGVVVIADGRAATAALPRPFDWNNLYFLVFCARSLSATRAASTFAASLRRGLPSAEPSLSSKSVESRSHAILRKVAPSRDLLGSKDGVESKIKKKTKTTEKAASRNEDFL